jgi:hypothetical protein
LNIASLPLLCLRDASSGDAVRQYLAACNNGALRPQRSTSSGALISLNLASARFLNAAATAAPCGMTIPHVAHDVLSFAYLYSARDVSLKTDGATGLRRTFVEQRT